MLLLRLLFILLVSFSVQAEEEEQESNEPLTTSPAWTLKMGDKAYGSEQFKGKPYVLHFWATWCPYCKRLQPGLDSIAKDYRAKGIQTYAMSFWENKRAKPIREMKNRGLGLKVLVKGDEVAKSFHVQTTPTTFFIDQDGDILATLNTSDPNDPQIRLAYEQLKDGYKEKELAEPEQVTEQTEAEK